MKYTVIIEKGESSFGAYVPDLPGCVAVAESESEVIDLIKEAIDLHLEDIKSEFGYIPNPQSKSLLVEVD